MKAEIIAGAARAALSGSIPFQQVIRRLRETGVVLPHRLRRAAEDFLQRRWRRGDHTTEL